MNTNRISPIDLSFLLLERPNRPFHMTAFTIFQKPKGQHSSFGSRLFDAYRHSRAIEPFNYRLSWLGRNVARWEIVEPDMRNHVQHIVLPGPGSMAQFYETVSFLNTGLLDRGTRCGSATSSMGLRAVASPSCSRCTTRSSTVRAGCVQCAVS